MLKKFQELTDSQWEYLTIFLPVQRKRKINLRSVVNAILKVLTTGMQWRNLDDKYPARAGVPPRVAHLSGFTRAQKT